MNEITDKTVEIKNLCYSCAGRLPKHWEKIGTIATPFRCEKCGRMNKIGGTYKYHHHHPVDDEE